MELYWIEKTTPSCLSHKNGSIIIHDMTDGDLAFNWLNLPTKANLFDSGRSVYNLDCGSYFLEIFNLESSETDYVEVVLDCEHLLSIDLVHLEGCNCYGDSGFLNIGWSGGVPPYYLTVNNQQHITNAESFRIPAKNNTTYTVNIKDSNNCSAHTKSVIKKIEPLKVSVNWTPIKFHGAKIEEISCNISGGTPPYSIAWFEKDKNSPIIVNQQKIENQLTSGTYRVLVKDNSKCSAEKLVTISDPQPIRVQIKHSADYASEASHVFDSFGRIYNLVLINTKKYPDIKSKKIQTAFLTHKNRKIDQRMCMDMGETVIGNQKYFYFYISPGLSKIEDTSSTLTIGEDSYELYHDTTFNSSNKLVVGSLNISQDRSYALEKGIPLELRAENESITAICGDFHVSNGMYFSFNIHTHINFISSDKTDGLASVLKFINNNSGIKIFSKYNLGKKYGEINCSVYNIDHDTAKVLLIDENNNEKYYDIIDNQLNIKNLTGGDYKLKISDDYNTAVNYNNTDIAGDFYRIKIVKSFEEEQVSYKAMNMKIYGIDDNLLNTYDNSLSKKILFMSPNCRNGVLLNICPLDACFRVFNEDNDLVLEDCGHKMIDLDKGKYIFEIFKDGYISSKRELFHNSQKSIVTASLRKSNAE